MVLNELHYGGGNFAMLDICTNFAISKNRKKEYLSYHMEKEFEDYWTTHQRRLILNAPEKLRKEYLQASRLDSPLDWIGFILPIGLGIALQPFLPLQSEILSWAITFVFVVLSFALVQMLKPRFTNRRTVAQVLDEIKQYYYQRYKKIGNLHLLEPWND